MDAQTYLLRVPVIGKMLNYLVELEIIHRKKESMIAYINSQIDREVYQRKFLHVLDTIKVPKFIVKRFGATLDWILGSSPPVDNSVPMSATLKIQRQQQLDLMEQQRLLSKARESRGGNIGRFHNRQQMAQGCSERLVPPANNGGLFGHFHTQNIRNNTSSSASLLRRETDGSTDSGEMANGINQNHIDASTPVQEHQVKTLVEIGFERQNAVRALQSCNSDVNRAIAILLN